VSQAVALDRIGVASVAGLAHHLGLSEPASLSRVCRRLTGRPVRDVLQEVDAERVVHDLAARVSA
jgi:AraC-like DNA-binding protein